MHLEFQKNIASSQFTLPIVSIIVILIWAFVPVSEVQSLDVQSHGLWSFVPAVAREGRIGMLVSLGMSALSVYLLAELTNSNVLLRISSRMLSSSLAVLLGVAVYLHALHPGHWVMFFALLSFFPLFATYQMPLPVPTMLAYMCLSIASFAFPQLLYLVPVYWIIQIYLRSFSLRCFLASFFGVLLPYWFMFGVMVNFDNGIQDFVNVCLQIADVKMPVYSGLHLNTILVFSLIVILFLTGSINFMLTSFRDKTRVRVLYNLVFWHGISIVLFILLQPQNAETLLPLLIVDASIMYGHFIALTYNRFAYIYGLVAFALMIILLCLQIALPSLH